VMAPRNAKPKPGQFGVIKRRGRPPKVTSLSPRELYTRLKVSFLNFPCEWRGCKAELHNMKTLRRHVDYVHLEDQEDEDQWYCDWGKCGELENGRGFPSYQELASHVGTVHMEPFAWHMGDGPSSKDGIGRRTLLEEEEEEEVVPSYLKDKDGNQVTPSIRSQEMENRAAWRDKRRKLRALLRERDRNLPSESGESEQDA
jgi:hypothetical protein